MTDLIDNPTEIATLLVMAEHGTPPAHDAVAAACAGAHVGEFDTEMLAGGVVLVVLEAAPDAIARVIQALRDDGHLVQRGDEPVNLHSPKESDTPRTTPPTVGEAP